MIEGETFYCSELIWVAYQQVGIDIDAHPGFHINSFLGVTPQELYDDDVTIYQISSSNKKK